MARVQLVIPDSDRDRFVDQARREGKTLSAWLRDAAHAKLQQQHRVQRFESTKDIREFFQACDAVEGPGTEPDWSEHLEAINKSRSSGTTGT